MSNQGSSHKTVLPAKPMFSGVGDPNADSDGGKKSEAALLFVPHLVARQAAENPDAIALQSASQVLTYGDLDRQANQLANHLIAMGVGPEKLVGVYLERSPRMVMAALAILKTGGAYLPLDPTFPAERLDSILSDADVCVIITRSGMPSRLAAGNWLVVDIEVQRLEIAAHPSEGPVVELDSDQLAYVVFTSGSTGRPKGVEITHGGLCNLITWHWRAFQVTAADRASHQAALGFDAAVWEIWPYLTIGACVHIPEEAVRNNPEALCHWLLEWKITITFLATALAERMMFLEWPPETALRILLTGADTLRHRPSAKLPFTLVNNYGPTECTVVATSAPVAPRECKAGRPSIGRAIDNTQLYILDEQMKPVRPGNAGELYIGGAGVARGYRNRAELTRQSFVADPFSSNAARLYRTGDLVRSLADGEIEFLGRLDEQIKIRGYRIEPGDIVSALNSHPDVQSSVVIAREDEAGEKRLVAYVILNSAQQPPTAGAIREHLRKQLPDYMVPASFVRLLSLPLTANGKVDKTTLPLPTGGNSLPDAEFIAPRGIVEVRLAAVIGSLLNVERVGVNDNFLLLGGHSLLGTQLLTRVSQTFGVELSLLNLFDHPTLAEMSQQIEKLILEKIAAMNGAPQRFVPPVWMEGNPR